MPLREALILFGCLVVAIILHEICHGLAAAWLGDDTARRAGRLTLNPVPHIDPFGSIVLPAMGALAGLPIVGYAKPVPIDPGRLRSPRRDMVFVSLAGPACNLTLCVIAALTSRWLYQRSNFGLTFDLGGPDLAFQIVFAFAYVNLLLGLFNLLPIPPLDGSAVIEPFLPREWLPHWYRFRPYGLLVVFALVFMIPGLIDTILAPFREFLIRYVAG